MTKSPNSPGKWPRLLYCCILTTILITLLLTIFYQQTLWFPFPTVPIASRDTNRSISTSSIILSNSTTRPTMLLVWTSFSGSLLSQPQRMFIGCPSDVKCMITHDRNRLNESSAVLFHTRTINMTDLPKNRFPHQYYVFSLWESPENTGIDLRSPQIRHFFNLTLTYRLDSDGYWPYSTFGVTRSAKIDMEKTEKIVRGKSKMLAWFVSHCKTPAGRELFVDVLTEYLPVDIYGKCGPFKCERKLGPDDPCGEMLTKDYKFYLSLENSLCRDYVTEKLYHRMKKSIIIPIVMERKLVIDTIRDGATAEVINKSIIAVDDFPNVKALAEYLWYLDKNTTAYMEYLQWKRTHAVAGRPPLCQFCRIIQEGKERKIDIIDWWIDRSVCHPWTSSRTGYF